MVPMWVHLLEVEASHEPDSQAVGNEQNVPKRSWAVSRSERNTELSMNLSVGARSIAPRVAVSTSGRSNAPRSRFMAPMRVQCWRFLTSHEPASERGIYAASSRACRWTSKRHKCRAPVQGQNARTRSEKSLPIEGRGRNGPRATQRLVQVLLRTSRKWKNDWRPSSTCFPSLLCFCQNANHFGVATSPVESLRLRSMIPKLSFPVPQRFHWLRIMNWSTEIDFPLPSTGRGIEGEGWKRSNRFRGPQQSSPSFRLLVPLPKSPLTPTLSPLRGEGEVSLAPREFWSPFRRKILATIFSILLFALSPGLAQPNDPPNREMAAKAADIFSQLPAPIMHFDGLTESQVKDRFQRDVNYQILLREKIADQWFAALVKTKAPETFAIVRRFDTWKSLMDFIHDQDALVEVWAYPDGQIENARRIPATELASLKKKTREQPTFITVTYRDTVANELQTYRVEFSFKAAEVAL